MIDLGKAQKMYEHAVLVLKKRQESRQRAEAIFDNCVHNERSAREALENTRDVLNHTVRAVQGKV